MGYEEQLRVAVKAASGIKIEQVYFIACGGSKAIMDAPQYIFDHETTLLTAVYTSNEFNYCTPKALGSNSVVITCSHSGTTPETVAAAKLAKEKGAVSIALSNVEGSPLWEACGYPISYKHGPDIHGKESNNGVLYMLVFSLLNMMQPDVKYEKALKLLDQLQSVIETNMELFKERSVAYGERNKRESIIYTMASAPNFGVAYSFSICLLMEMLWKHSSAINSGEYFHGPLEITDYDVPFLLLKGVGPGRFMDERAEQFIKRFSGKLEVVDAKTFDWGGIDDSLKDYFCPIIATKVLRKYADGLSFSTGHPLSVRRYMWRLEY